MKTELVVLGKHISVASQRSRRWLVALVYAGFAAVIVGWTSFNATTRAWCGIFGLVVLLMFLAIAGSSDDPADERESWRREHAYFVAYRWLAWMLILALSANYLRGPNPTTPLVGPVLRGVLGRLPHMLPHILLMVYFTLPQAILMWTEPDIDADQAEVIRLWAKG